MQYKKRCSSHGHESHIWVFFVKRDCGPKTSLWPLVMKTTISIIIVYYIQLLVKQATI